MAARVRPSGHLVAAVSATVLLLLTYAPFLVRHLNTRKNDFSAVYLWSAAVRMGLNPYTDNLSPLEEHFSLDPNGNQLANYPPSLIVAFEPITLLPPTIAYWLWFCFSVFTLIAALTLILGRRVFIFAPVALLYEPLTDHFLWAQSYTVGLLLIDISIRAIANGRDTVAGVSIAAAGALKLFPLVMLLYAVRTMRWRVVLSAAVAVAAISALTIAMLGENRAFSFLGSTSPEVWARWAFAHSNVSTGAIIAQWVATLMAISSPSDHPLLWLWIFVGSALGVSAIVFFSTPANDPDLRAFGLWIVIGTWIFPICWPAHLVLFLAFFADLVYRANRASVATKLAAISSLALGVILLPIHWILLLRGPIDWLSAVERTCLIMLVLSAFYSAWLFSRADEESDASAKVRQAS